MRSAGKFLNTLLRLERAGRIHRVWIGGEIHFAAGAAGEEQADGSVWISGGDARDCGPTVHAIGVGSEVHADATPLTKASAAAAEPIEVVSPVDAEEAAEPPRAEPVKVGLKMLRQTSVRPGPSCPPASAGFVPPPSRPRFDPNAEAVFVLETRLTANDGPPPVELRAYSQDRLPEEKKRRGGRRGPRKSVAEPGEQDGGEQQEPEEGEEEEAGD